MSDHKKEEKKNEVPPSESLDSAIRRFEDEGPQKPESRLDLLDNFLKQITGSVSVPAKSASDDFKDIHSIEWSEYPEMETS